MNFSIEFDETTLIKIAKPLLLVEFILGSIGNAIALWIFCFRMKPWKPSTIYLFNLTIADFLLMCCLPFRLAYYANQKDWIFGDVACRMLLFMVSLNRAGSIAFLTLVAIDRYFKVVLPHHKLNSMSQRYATVGVTFIWALMILMTSYLLFERHVFEQKNLTYCESFNLYESFNVAATWHDMFFVIEFVGPLCIILFCTFSIISKLQHKKSEIRRKYKKAIRIVIIVVIVFILCFLPSNIGRLVVLAQSSKFENSEAYKAAIEGFYITLCLTYINSMLDPIVYYFSSSKFKNALHQKNSHKAERKKTGNSSCTSDSNSEQVYLRKI
ncbi:hydroxycarboxylic acid receptor 1-like [Carcharodon carcharias]|uniref:hydroxycarboxylic acid receptor 1-like n=1 Tax=Carcharodon carcharias TaxID=13397 RepID=UPI001B7DEFCB|nr:hydroxycarboxylic acid receptor 1-like [Carcharodon carcharias]